MNETPTETALMAIEPHTAVVTAITPAQARVDAVSNALHKAYERASTLQLTKEESEALAADFPDDAFQAGAQGKEHLIYIEHAYLRDRFTQVLGIGQWVVVRTRPHWAEAFKFFSRTEKRELEGTRLYAECALIIRGCFVSENIGSMDYYPNQQTNYGDAAKGAVTAAFRRCASDIGVGLQAWKEGFVEGWLARRRGQSSSATAPPRTQSAKTTPPPAQTPKSTFTREETPAGKKEREKRLDVWLTACKDKFLADHVANEASLWEFVNKKGWIMDNEKLSDIPVTKLFPSINMTLDVEANKAACKKDYDAVVKEFGRFCDGGDGPPDDFAPAEPPINTSFGALGTTKIEVPRDANLDPNSPDAPWRSFPMPWGVNKDTKLADLEKKYLYGQWANYTVETTFNGKPKRPETIAKDTEFREALDAAGSHYGFTKKD